MNTYTPAKNVASAILSEWNRDPDLAIMDIDGEAFSARDGLAWVQARGEALRDAGLVRGDRIALPDGRGGAFFLDLVTVWAEGMVAIPFAGRDNPKRMNVIMSKSHPRAILTERDNYPDAPVEHFFPAFQKISNSENTTPRTGDDGSGTETAAILFTSGSTGDPKGVVLSHNALLGNSLGILEELDLTINDRLCVAIPFSFTSAINHFLATQLKRACFCGTEKNLLPGDYIKWIRTASATCVGGAPVQLRWLSEDESCVAKQLKWVMSSGDYLPPAIIKMLMEKFPKLGIVTVYGLTELGGRFCVLLPCLAATKAGSVGRPIKGLSVTIVDDKGKALPANMPGEVVADGDFLMDGYLDAPEETKTKMCANGFRTGDIGHLDADGFLWLQGRTDDVFKCSGKKVSTVAIGSVIEDTGFFKDFAVVAVEDPVLGHVPHVLYVTKTDEAPDTGEIKQRIRNSLGGHHIPRKYHAVEAIPRTGSGKVDRNKLRALLNDLLNT